jgi:hypothetical protein
VLNWLRNLLDSAARGIGDGADKLARAAAAGIASVFAYVSGDVSDAWDTLERAADGLEQYLTEVLAEHTRELIRLFTYDIPHFAETAWWWVTHPAQLAEALGWHLVRWLEDNAWTAADYLGQFALALILRNVRRIAHLAEHVITAIL